MLLSHPAVQDAAVVSKRDDDAIHDELPTAIVVLKPQHTATQHELRQFVAGIINRLLVMPPL